MQKYAKIIDEEKKIVSVGTGTNVAFYKKIGMKLAEVEQNEDGEFVLIEWIPEPEPPEPEEQPEEQESEGNNDEEQANNPLADY